MSHNTLESYYTSIFALTFHHKWPDNIEDMYPFERDIYINMINDHMEKLKEEAKQQENIRKALERKGY